MQKKKLVYAIILIIVGSIGRLLLTSGSPISIVGLNNVETITIAALLAGAFLGGLYTVAVPLGIVALTDIFIGNSSIMLFTWSAWALIGFGGLLLRRENKKSFLFVLQLTGVGMVTSLFFYLWTNFGVWLLWPKMYALTISGLVQCYLMGLPFLKFNLIGNLVIIPLAATTLVCWLRYRERLVWWKTALPKNYQFNERIAKTEK